MKQIVYTFIIVFFGIIVFSSCKKHFYCGCTYGYQVVYNADLGNLTQSDAQNICDTNTHRVPGETWNCTLH